MDRFRLAARAYLVYGVIYWLGGFYLALQGVGVRGDRTMQPGVAWIVLGLVLVVAIPYLLAGAARGSSAGSSRAGISRACSRRSWRCGPGTC